MVGLFVIAPQIINTIFGPQWTRSIFLVQVLALVGLIQSISTLNGSIYQSQGRTNIQFRVGIVFSIIITIFFIIGLQWNLEGIVVSYLIANLIS